MIRIERSALHRLGQRVALATILVGAVCQATSSKISLTKTWKSSWTKGFTVRYHKCWRDTSHDAYVGLNVNSRPVETVGFEATPSCPKELSGQGEWSIDSVRPGVYNQFQPFAKEMKIRNGTTLVFLRLDSGKSTWWLDYECNGISNKDLWMPSFAFAGRMGGPEHASDPLDPNFPPSAFEAFAHGIRCDSVKKMKAPSVSKDSKGN
jgi:hypothetical protein